MEWRNNAIWVEGFPFTWKDIRCDNSMGIIGQYFFEDPDIIRYLRIFTSCSFYVYLESIEAYHIPDVHERTLAMLLCSIRTSSSTLNAYCLISRTFLFEAQKNFLWEKILRIEYFGSITSSELAQLKSKGNRYLRLLFLLSRCNLI